MHSVGGTKLPLEQGVSLSARTKYVPGATDDNLRGLVMYLRMLKNYLIRRYFQAGMKAMQPAVHLGGAG